MARKLVRLELDIDRLLHAKALAWDWMMETVTEYPGMEKQFKELLDCAYENTEPSKGYK